MSCIRDVRLEGQAEDFGVIAKDGVRSHPVPVADPGFLLHSEEAAHEGAKRHPDGFQERQRDLGIAGSAERDVKPVVLAHAGAGVAGLATSVHPPVAGRHLRLA
ncbi:MAG: hypothetical protein KDK53_01200 [Maritimibacter sp.]|nr:hypothetical protein [Maritimibacter sp.]